MARIPVGSVGDYIREQRGHAQFSLRQLADAAGVSNPYLSQIERGLRKPSAEILQQIAKGLRISAETLYVRAGILEEQDGDHAVPVAIVGDTGLTERQKRVLLDIYDTFRKENAEGARQGAADGTDVATAPHQAASDAAPRSAAATRKVAAKRPATPRAPRKTAAAGRARPAKATAAKAGTAKGLSAQSAARTNAAATVAGDRATPARRRSAQG